MEELEKMNFRGDPNLGLFAITSDELCLMGHTALEKEVEAVKKNLQVEVKQTSIGGSNLIGIFSAINRNGIVLPENVKEEEVNNLKKLDLNIYILEGVKETALGNLILINDKGCIISERLEKVKEDLEKCFEVDAKVGTIAGLNIVGSCGVATNKGLLAHINCEEEEMEHLEEVLEVEGNIGTANFGSPFVGACIIANSEGVLVSNQTTGPETGRIVESLKFV